MVRICYRPVFQTDQRSGQTNLFRTLSPMNQHHFAELISTELVPNVDLHEGQLLAP